jgi:glycosyltransferase involved in cell wall biosynthesis
MRVLVVSPQPFFSPRGTPFSVYYRTLVTAELGHDIDILTYGQGADLEIPNTRIVRIPAFWFLGKVKPGPSMLKLLLDVFMVVWTVGLLLFRRYDVVHAHEESVFWCRWLKPVFRFRLIYDMHSSLPQQLINFEYTRVRGLHWLFTTLERTAVRAADGVITICPLLHAYAQTLTDDHEKIYLIENSIFDPVPFPPSWETSEQQVGPLSLGPTKPLNEIPLEQWLSRRLKDQLVVYAGTLLPYQGIPKLLEAFALVCRSWPEAGLLVVGGFSSEVAPMRVLAQQLGIGERVFFTGVVTQARAQALVKNAVAAISPRFSGDNTPLKIYQLMATGVPLIATRIDSHTQVLDDEIATLTGVGIEDLAAGIEAVLAAPEMARGKAARAMQHYEACYSRDLYVAKMRELFARVA